MVSWKKRGLFWLLLLNIILLSASRSIHKGHGKRKAVKGTKKQTMYIPGAVSMGGSPYGQYPTAQGTGRTCCSSQSYGYQSQYPYQPQQQSCCDSSSPPPCCIKLKPGESKEVKLNAAGKDYLLTVNLDGKDAASEKGKNKSKDASPTSSPSQSGPSNFPTNTGPTSAPTVGGSSTGSTMGPTTSPTTGLPINVNSTSNSNSSTPTSSPSGSQSPNGTGDSLNTGIDSISEDTDKILSIQNGQSASQGSKSHQAGPEGVTQKVGLKGEGKLNKEGQGDSQGNHGQEYHGQEQHGQGQKGQNQGQGQGQKNQPEQPNGMHIYVGTPLIGMPQEQYKDSKRLQQDKGKRLPNGKGNCGPGKKKLNDACMEGPSMCGQQSASPCGQAASPPCAPPPQPQGISPCPPVQAVSMPCFPQQVNPCQQPTPMSCAQQQMSPCPLQAANPCTQTAPSSCASQPCCVNGSGGENGKAGTGGENAGVEGGETGKTEGAGEAGAGGEAGTGEGVGTGGGPGTGGENAGVEGGETGKTEGGGEAGAGGEAGTGEGVGTGGGSAEVKSCIQQTLNLHNSLRSKHNSPPLKLNENMNQGALSYAKSLAATGTGDLNHSPKDQRSGQGENLARSCSKPAKPPNCKEMTQRWYDEIRLYNWGQSGFARSTGHFTQVVWKATTELGVGVATFQRKDGMTCHVLVARYKPAGNVPGQFRTNVLKISVK